ncbi:MAG: hypothetical protein COT18_04155 [Elusimicrobia bacterium CG08_land_8_20_14_0_20_59_10]|nr:MAG: hypothetical protein COT18_04155 [Elusimicrobia bacterium CG08_land_8_20_14_0_20_59_10]
MENEQEIPERIKCPYCGADNHITSEACGACLKDLLVPAQVRAEAKMRERAAELTLPAPPSHPAQRPAYRLWIRLLVIGGLALVYLQWFRQTNYFSFLDHTNLVIHEAGHVVFGFFPRFLMVAGGSIFQLLVPAVCVAAGIRQGQNLSWQLCLFWLGESLLNISVYAGDAARQALPLVGGGHDWAYLLTELGLIAHPRGVASVIFAAGSAVIFLSFYFIWKDALARESIELGGD